MASAFSIVWQIVLFVMKIAKVDSESYQYMVELGTHVRHRMLTNSKQMIEHSALQRDYLKQKVKEQNGEA